MKAPDNHMQEVLEILRSRYGEEELQKRIVLGNNYPGIPKHFPGKESMTPAINNVEKENTTPPKYETKWCPKCKTYKSIKYGEEEFYRNRSRPDGLSDWCKICHRESMNKPKKSRPAAKKKNTGSAVKAKSKTASKKASSVSKPSDRNTDTGTGHNKTSTVPMKTCTGCEEPKPADLTHFNRSSRSSDKLDSLCKECRNLKKRQVRQMNRFTLSIDLSCHPEVFDRIKEIAEKEERTMEAQVRYWLKTNEFSGEASA